MALELEAALIGFGGAILGVVAGGMLTARTAKWTVVQQQAGELAKLRLQHRFAQANEFYGPLQAIRTASSQVYRQLLAFLQADGRMPANPKDFALVDYLPGLMSDSVYGPLIGEIIKLGNETEALMRGKAGLVEGPWPESFSTYLAHIAVMRAASIGANPNSGQAGSLKQAYFPRELDDDIKRGADVVRADLERIQGIARRYLYRSLNVTEEDLAI